MRILTLALFVSIDVVLFACCGGVAQKSSEANGIEQAFKQHKSGVQVEDEGEITRLLSDDTAGIVHQRFIVRSSSGQTVLLEYNTDVSPRIEDLKVGETVDFAGEYIWNEQGGIVHWTHHDPGGRHEPGWLKHNGRTYQ
ncbi:MAG: DUF3465 domain-containing protein [Acidobacteriota bacterium]